jgi:acyl carrier protein
MTPDEIRAVVLRTLGRIAPEADVERLRPDLSFREQLELDSMDFLNFVLALHKEVSSDIPEQDYPKLATLDGCVQYIAALKKGGTSGPPPSAGTSPGRG